MPKQEYKILEFHGGTNSKFDPRDIADNQNAYSQLSVNKVGRLVKEGDAKNLYNKTDINGHAITDITASPSTGGFTKGYGLFSFPHDYEMVSDIIQDGTDVDTDDSNWAAVNSDGDGTVAWNNAAPSVFDTSANEDASIYNTLGGDKLEANSKYILSFDVVTATLNLAIGGGDASGNTADETYVAAADYSVGTHSVTFIPASAATHLWFTADSSEISADGSINNISCFKFPEEVNTDFICINDANGIDIYDPNQSTEWQQNKFYLGSRIATVKPEYYNVDGALRVCDTNFSVTDAAMDTAADIGKNDITLTIDNGAGGNVTLASGSIIQIDQEIMYVVTGVTGGTSVKVIRGYANTKIATHSNNTNIFYANIPKYFGHIKADRLFECATSNDVNTWVEDVQTPQPPNNTRKSDGTTATLANSAGVQSLRVYDTIEGSTANYPAESEKVVLEFREGAGDVGIINVEHVSGTTLRLTTSGRGASTTLGHKLTEGTMISIDNVQTTTGVDLSDLSGTFQVLSTPTATTFTIQDDNFSASMVENATPSGDAAYSATVDGFSDHNATVEGHVKVSNDEANLPGLQGTAGDTFPIHITGQTGVPSYNGIHIATMIDADDLSFAINTHASAGDAAGTTEIQQLLGIVRPEGSGAINPDLKRKWNFAMSFTYDGPGQEIQESLLTMGHTIVPLDRNNGTANRLAAAMGDTSTTANHDIDDASVLSVGDVIMVDSEQMLITAVDTSASPDHINVTRGYNGSTAATHSDDVQIYKITELNTTETVDWTNFIGVPECVIKSVYNYGVDEKSWNARINGFKIYMKDVTEEDASKEFRLFTEFNFNKGTYTLFGAGDSELILEQPGTWSSDGQICTVSTGTEITMKPIDTYLSENLFTEQTIIDAQYKASCVAGRKVYIGNIKQGGRTYPDRMLRTPVNKFDTFPETNFIDVAIGDGDEITVLESFGDRILQFKKSKLYVINISGEFEVLESEYLNAGVSTPSRVVKTDVGVAWINTWGLWFFDGQQVRNLTRNIKEGSYSDQDLLYGNIGYDNTTNRLIYAANMAIGMQTGWYIYDLGLNAYQEVHDGSLFPHSDTGNNFYTNMIHDSKGNMVVGYVDAGTATELNFYQWDSSAGEGQSSATTNMFKSKDIDFGSPSVRKKVHKIYVTYKCTGHSGIQMKYATNGSGSFSGTFSSSSSTNYNADSFTSNGTKTGFKDSSGDWAVAELKPTSSINNIKSIQLSLDHLVIDSGTARGGSSTTIQLRDHASISETDNAYNDYNIYLYGGPARYNTTKISDYTGSSETVEVEAAMTDKGYGNATTSDSKYILGAVATDFEINDITIIYRAKPVK
jgi:hypothetical protein